MRYEHWLRPAKPSPWPGAVLCLSCSVEWTRADDTARREYAKLASWHVQLCTRHGDGYAVSRSATGGTADGFWDCVRTATLRGRNVWIISTDFRAVAAVLGLWDRLEDGRVRISGRDHKQPISKRAVRDVQLPCARTGLPDQADMGTDTAARPMPGPLVQAGGRERQEHAGRKGAVGGICVLEDPPIILELRGDGWGGRVTWVDEANYGIDIGGSSEQRQIRAETLAAWYRAAASTLRSIGPCGWQATAGSQAMHLYRSVYHATPTLCHTERDATALERAGLFGGRCEPFRLGVCPGPVHLYDFRSMYPYLYSTTRVPVRLVSVEQSPPVAQILADDQSHWWIARVDIETDEPEYPYHAGPATIYPVGRFTTVLCGPELGRAIKQSRIVRVRAAARYEADYALKGYAEALYSCRVSADRDTNTLLAAWCKRLMNCLHGKFAQQECHWEECPGAECPWEWGEWYHRLPNGDFQRRRVIGGRITKEVRGGFSHGTVPGIGCSISSAGRSRLNTCIACAGRDSTYYVDTDSLIVGDSGAQRLQAAGWVSPGEWGYLQHVISAASCDIGGVKRYSIGNRIVEAGRAANASTSDSAADSAALIPGVREQLTRQQAPADWREAHPWQPGPGRYEQRRGPGGWVRPVELWKWDGE